MRCGMVQSRSITASVINNRFYRIASLETTLFNKTFVNNRLPYFMGICYRKQRIADTLDPSMPNAQHIRDNIMRRLDPTSAAKQIWGQLPPKPGISLISFGEPPEDPQYRFEDQRKKSVNVPGWQLMYR